MIGLGIALVACSNKKEVRAAKSSVYDIDFAVVYSGALQATRELYANLDDNPGSGKIMTAWHQVQYANNTDDLSNQRVVAQQQGVQQGGAGVSPGAAAAGMPTRLAYKRYFIRFDVSVIGGRPWRVKVSGHAAEWDPGNALPTELRGMARPPWLDGRIEALQVAIYRKIKPYAIKAKEEPPPEKTEPDLPKTDPTVFKGVAAPAAKTLAAIKDALALRDNTALRAQLADDVVWSLGGAPGADTAMAMWQADPESLDAMGRTIAGGCGTDARSGSAGPRSTAAGGAEVRDKKVACPPGPPITGSFQLVIEPRGEAWKVTSFVKAE